MRDLAGVAAICKPCEQASRRSVQHHRASRQLRHRGRIRARIRVADARAEAAAARYERTVLGALNDSETALNRFASAQRSRADAEAARQQSADALLLARQRQEAGEDDLIALLQAQSAYSAAESAAVDARANELQALIALYKALGGGWESYVPQGD